MRFLIVYQDFAVAARELVDRLGVRDVQIIVARKREKKPGPEEQKLLTNHLGAPAAACQLNRKYRKSIDGLVKLEYTAKVFRAEDQQLESWLVPAEQKKKVEYGIPSGAFLNVAGRTKDLILADNALVIADQLADHRRRFVNLAADLLSRCANGESLGPMRNWKAQHGVEFAANGPVRFRYAVNHDSGVARGATEWHLKEGDNTARERAARVYFDRVSLGSSTKVVVLYVGPHPKGGDHDVHVQAGS